MTSTTAKPEVLEVLPDGIPDELKSHRSSGYSWRLEPKGDRLDKASLSSRRVEGVYEEP